jgi:hypothetical protein
VVQCCGNILFTIAAMILWIRSNRHSRKTRTPTSFPKTSKFKLFVAAIIISDIVIIVRAVYRVIELAQGWEGHLITTEAFFYGLDSVSMVICMVIWVIGHPGLTLGKNGLKGGESRHEDREAMGESSI